MPCVTSKYVLESTRLKNDQSLAGGLFNVASRIGTSMGVALTSTVSTYVINARGGNLVSGYRAAGWVCFGVAVATMLASIVGLRDLKALPDAFEELERTPEVELQDMATENRELKV